MFWIDLGFGFREKASWISQAASMTLADSDATI